MRRLAIEHIVAAPNSRDVTRQRSGEKDDARAVAKKHTRNIEPQLDFGDAVRFNRPIGSRSLQ